LAREGARIGQKLEWSEVEREHLAAACRAADRIEALEARFAAELADKARPTSLAGLSAEVRLLDKALAHHLEQVNVGVPVDNARQRRAANARWNYHRGESAWGRKGGA
jgi:hypothetical protein